MTDRIAGILARAEPAQPRPLGDLVARIAARGLLLGGSASADDRTPILGVTQDSRAIRPGQLFVAIHGLQADGHAFIEQAVAAGAAAVIVEEPRPDVRVPQVAVGDARRALAVASAWWYEDPSRRLGVVGVTGTDGKTTTCYLAASALEAAGFPTGMIGTIATTIAGVHEPNPTYGTTLEAPELQRALRAMVLGGDRAAVVETTSHGLAMERVAEVGYDVAIFTNLTHEHLDLHGTWEAYRAAKLRLFEGLATGSANPAKPTVGWPRTGIVNADDPSSATFSGAVRAAGARLITYGEARGADVRLVSVDERADGLHVAYVAPAGHGTLHLPLAGRFNAHNALAVVGLGEALGLDREAIAAGVERVERVPGRMERIECGQPFGVIVDYSHTPGALEAAGRALSELVAPAAGGLITVVGASGERDVGKRPLMGRAAAAWSRLVIVTEDDSRNEDPGSIYEAIAVGAEAAGLSRGETLLVIPDRRAAIAEAFARARPGDVVLLAGKGHETWNMGPAGPEPWSERGVAEETLDAMGFGPDEAAS